MQLENGDYFAVINGQEIGAVILGANPSQLMATMQTGEPPSGEMDVKPKYDKSHEGLIYKVLEHTPGSQLAAVEVAYDSFGPLMRGESWIGKRFSLNVKELKETMTVTKSYVDHLREAWELEKADRIRNEQTVAELIKLAYSNPNAQLPALGGPLPPAAPNISPQVPTPPYNTLTNLLNNNLDDLDDPLDDEEEFDNQDGLDNPLR